MVLSGPAHPVLAACSPPQTAAYLAQGGCQYHVSHVYVWNLESWDVQVSSKHWAGCCAVMGSRVCTAEVLGCRLKAEQGGNPAPLHSAYTLHPLVARPSPLTVGRPSTPSAPPARAATGIQPLCRSSTSTTGGRAEAAVSRRLRPGHLGGRLAMRWMTCFDVRCVLTNLPAVARCVASPVSDVPLQPRRAALPARWHARENSIMHLKLQKR